MYGRMLNMGFGEDEAAGQIRQLELPGVDTGGNFENTPIGQGMSGGEKCSAAGYPSEKSAGLSQLAEAAEGIEVRKTESGFEVVSSGMMSQEAEKVVLACAAGKQEG